MCHFMTYGGSVSIGRGSILHVSHQKYSFQLKKGKIQSELFHSTPRLVFPRAAAFMTLVRCDSQALLWVYSQSLSFKLSALIH